MHGSDMTVGEMEVFALLRNGEPGERELDRFRVAECALSEEGRLGQHQVPLLQNPPGDGPLTFAFDGDQCERRVGLGR